MTDQATGPIVRNGAVVAEQAPTSEAVPDIDTPLYRSVEDIPSPTSKQVKDAVAARELTEGLVGLNGGWAPGPSPNNLARRNDPNRIWDKATNRFIPGTEYGGNPPRRR